MGARTFPRTVCTVPHYQATGWTDDGNEQTFEAVECGEEVHLVWSYGIDVAGLDQVIEPADAAGWGFASDWKLTCGRGHVLAVSANDNGDSAGPFDPSLLPPLPYETREVEI